MTFMVSFIGIDGSGKSTQVTLLESSLRSRGATVVTRHHFEPRSKYGKSVKSRLRRLLMPYLFLDKTTEKRSWAVERVTGIARGAVGVLQVVVGWATVVNTRAGGRRHIVITDRCFLDDLVMAEWRFGHSGRFRRFLVRNGPRPDVLVVLEIGWRTGFNRETGGELDAESFAAKWSVQRAVLEVAESEGWPVVEIEVDGLSPEDVHERILSAEPIQGWRNAT